MINIADTAVFSLDKGTLNGGVIKGAGTAAIAGSGLFKDLNIGGTLSVANGNIASVSGTITNDGTFKLVSTNSLTRLMLAGDTTLDGTGETVLGRDYNYIGSSSAGKTLTIGADQTLRGGGYIGSYSYGSVNVVNQGTVVADNGTLHAYGTTFDNTDGSVEVANGAIFSLDAGTFSGGKIVGTGTGAIGGGVFKDLNIDGTLSVANGNIASMSGTITNDGTFKLT
ncbi:hypothetical protein [Plasticicumulans sp.]|uniref:hypothetical protein n=1 Tax=Plasticicumulans sp. TaxID=2307179 RepID=UPI00395EA85E